MKVLSFDCGHNSLGVCLIDVNMLWVTRLNELVDSSYDKFTALHELDRLDDNDKKLLAKYIYSKLLEMIHAVENIYQIINVFSAKLVEGKVREAGIIQRAASSKVFLAHLHNKITAMQWHPDVILIEDQTINKMSSEIAGQIAFFFSPPYVYARHILLPNIQIYPPSAEKWFYDIGNDNQLPTKINCTAPTIVSVKPTLKNTIYFDETLTIDVFYMKYTTLYEANKNHTLSNFKYFMKVMHSYIYKPNKRQRDMSDAFIQAIAYFSKQD